MILQAYRGVNLPSATSLDITLTSWIPDSNTPNVDGYVIFPIGKLKEIC